MKRQAIILLGVGMVVAGCARARQEQGGTVPKPNPKPKVAVNVGDRVEAMRGLVDELGKVARELPGRDDQGQREAMRKALDVSAKVLPLLMGPDADGQFRLQQRIVADARDQLARQDGRLAQEPTVDAGLRAVYNALVRVSQESFYTNPTITTDLTELGERVDALDTVRGPLHRDAAAEAVQQSARVMDRMTRIYQARLGRRDAAPAVPNPPERS